MTRLLKQGLDALDKQENETALALLRQNAEANPGDAESQFWCACAHDRLGLEREAVPYYRAAIAAGLNSELEPRAYVGLGSSLRCFGEYKEAQTVLAEGMEKYPSYKALKVFWAMAAHNLGEYESSVQALLELLLECSKDESIARYSKAISFYASRLSERWD